MVGISEKINRFRLVVEAGHHLLDTNEDLASFYVSHIVLPPLEDLLKELVLEVDKQHRLHDVKDNLVVHYTSLNTIESLLEAPSHTQRPSLRLHDSSNFNDPEEGADFLRLLRLPQKHQWLLESTVTHAYIASFIIPKSKRDVSDELQYWVAYGDQGRGCSLQLNVPTERLRTVLYGSKLNRGIRNNLVAVLNILHPLVGIPSLRDILTATVWKHLGKVRYLYKHRSYDYEKECRFVVPEFDVELDEIAFAREPQDGTLVRVRHYVLNSVLDASTILATGSRITIGPDVPNPANVAFYLETLKRRAGWTGSDPEIRISKIPYRSS